MIHRVAHILIWASLCFGTAVLTIPAWAQPATPAPAEAPLDASFAVEFNGHWIQQPIMAVTAMPGEAVPLSMESRTTAAPEVCIEAPADTLTWQSEAPWPFVAPEEPGLYPLRIRHMATGQTIQLQVFVLTPWDHDGRSLDGYRVGRYQQEPRRGLEAYEPPEGFIRVTEDIVTAPVAPHFTLQQFLSKQTNATPEFILLQTPLLQLLEEVLAAVRNEGHNVETLHVMSAYRTPFYNASIGNTTVYSRHLYGDAADIFVDANGNGRMDDLTGDGRVTRADAVHLAEIVASVKENGSGDYTGGIGIYGPAPHRGPFVHVDVRGYRARW
ncbi:MAG: D-Ala-D-Ala carboxypeptidase family metallohydrolase [Longimonas sp.]|uniref:D-Ala-D-Ala carboxypeptidase family metallohydrolase n=1 Tax=Longimonas sp. TaxID=2039626 RepID=UPI00334A2BC5